MFLTNELHDSGIYEREYKPPKRRLDQERVELDITDRRIHFELLYVFFN